jgi:hypothetical protein
MMGWQAWHSNGNKSLLQKKLDIEMQGEYGELSMLRCHTISGYE